MMLVLLAMYFLPSIVALVRHRHNTGAILMLNLFLGWTCIGWVVAMVWAASSTPPTTVIIQQQPAEQPPNARYR
jgi:hypothetical protein